MPLITIIFFVLALLGLRRIPKAFCLALIGIPLLIGFIVMNIELSRHHRQANVAPVHITTTHALRLVRE